MKRSVVATAVVAVLAAAAGAAMAFTGGRETPVAQAVPVATAEVIRGDLVDTVSVEGTLTFTGERRIRTGAAGMITWVPRPEATIRQGGALFAADRRWTVLMRGEVPLYRALRQGVTDGPDVLQLERGLKALGYGDDMTVDRHFSYATAQAVRAWQKDRGWKRTGVVDASQVVFLPGTVRVTRVTAAVGDLMGPNAEVLTASSTRQVVRLDLDVDRQDLVRQGAQVSAELPGGKTVKGKVIRVGPVVRKASASQQGEESTVDVEIALSGGKKGRAFDKDQAPVTVTLESERREDVLSVPIEALLALRDGGFGIEVVEPGEARRTVGVRTGAYGGGRVEVSAPGLRAGTKVRVPAS
ncbi:peptidoglycan-binding protein [Nonomuraea cavernae]|uniref:Peptidoglycan binding-like domain-containing protein n=1 Tax=Nonomuraea cavernae TaxID=2045107 RepID=A0A917Z8W6_9ACTN|nr:peptidoglycan-binding protein [Nonomuraea cavernae]MCA2189851.1 peptidoglycan-binding protein [Nonomuraea cavernae]GGO77679.1 hypothetical protein GCM10012289_57900 [Nonomuraea cavernae]